jgi:hypothetical protein
MRPKIPHPKSEPSAYSVRCRGGKQAKGCSDPQNLTDKKQRVNLFEP